MKEVLISEGHGLKEEYMEKIKKNRKILQED